MTVALLMIWTTLWAPPTRPTPLMTMRQALLERPYASSWQKRSVRRRLLAAQPLFRAAGCKRMVMSRDGLIRGECETDVWSLLTGPDRVFLEGLLAVPEDRLYFGTHQAAFGRTIVSRNDTADLMHAPARTAPGPDESAVPIYAPLVESAVRVIALKPRQQPYGRLTLCLGPACTSDDPNFVKSVLVYWTGDRYLVFDEGGPGTLRILPVTRRSHDRHRYLVFRAPRWVNALQIAMVTPYFTAIQPSWR
jgi:hypothetical protein